MLSRRRWMALAAAAAWPMAEAAEDRFAALARPARPVLQPERAVLLGGAMAGRRIVAVGERGVVALSDDGGRSWRQARSVPASVSLTAVAFADEAKGWAVGHGGVVLATRDGGETWTLQADGRSLAASARRVAVALAGDPRATALAQAAELLVADGPDKPLLALQVVDATRVVAVGAYGLCAETLDGGATWTAALDRLDNPKAQHLYAIAVRGEQWLIAGEQGLVLRSSDGGRRFSRGASPYAGTWFAAASPAPGEWLLAGLRGQCWRSHDGGARWSQVEGAPPVSFASAAARPDGAVLLSSQAGQLFVMRQGGRLADLHGPSLPPLSQALPLPDGGILALGFAGAVRLPGAKA